MRKRSDSLQAQLRESNNELMHMQDKVCDLTSKMEEKEHYLDFAKPEVSVLRHTIEMMNPVDEKQIEDKYE